MMRMNTERWIALFFQLDVDLRSLVSDQTAAIDDHIHAPIEVNERAYNWAGTQTEGVRDLVANA